MSGLADGNSRGHSKKSDFCRRGHPQTWVSTGLRGHLLPRTWSLGTPERRFRVLQGPAEAAIVAASSAKVGFSGAIRGNSVRSQLQPNRIRGGTGQERPAGRREPASAEPYARGHGPAEPTPSRPQRLETPRTAVRASPAAIHSCKFLPAPERIFGPASRGRCGAAKGAPMHPAPAPLRTAAPGTSQVLGAACHARWGRGFPRPCRPCGASPRPACARGRQGCR